MKLFLAAAAAALLVGPVPSPASAQDTANVNVTAQIGGLTGGSRVLVVPESATGLTITGTAINAITASFTAEVVETLAPGSNGWTVNATLTDLSNGSGGTIPYGNVTMNPADTILTAPLPAGTNSGGTTQAFQDQTPTPSSTSAASNVFTNNGQVATSFYTATHTAAGNALSIELPEGEFDQGNYTGTLTVTLVD
jgi:hypothetical protein